MILIIEEDCFGAGTPIGVETIDQRWIDVILGFT